MSDGQAVWAAADKTGAAPRAPLGVAACVAGRLKASAETLFAMCDQGVLSIGNVLTGILVGRLLGAASLGVFTLELGILFLAVAILDATVCMTLISARARATEGELRDLSGRFLWLAGLFSVLCGGIAVGGLWWVEGAGGMVTPGLIGAIGLTFPAFLVRDFLRWYEIAFARAGSALVLDLLTIALQVGGIAGLSAAGLLSLPGCFWAMVAGNGAAITMGLLRWRGSFRWAGGGVGRLVGEVVSSSRWVVAALVLFLISAQMMPWLVTVRLGVLATGMFAACAGLANIGNPLVTGFINALMPAATLHVAEGRSSTRGRKIRIETIALCVVAGGVVVCVAAFAGPMLEIVYGKPYREVSVLLVILSGSFFLRSAAAAPYIGLWALGHADRNAAVNLGILIISAGLAWVAMPRFGVVAAGIGGLAGDVAGTAVRWVIFIRLARARGIAL